MDENLFILKKKLACVILNAVCTAGHRRAMDQNVTSECLVCPMTTWNGDLNNGDTCTQCRSNSDTNGEGKMSARDCGMCRNIYFCFILKSFCNSECYFIFCNCLVVSYFGPIPWFAIKKKTFVRI